MLNSIKIIQTRRLFILISQKKGGRKTMISVRVKKIHLNAYVATAQLINNTICCLK